MARKTEGLGKRHEKIMHFLAEFQEKKGFSPSIRDKIHFTGGLLPQPIGGNGFH
jgi:hypothetical protein